MSGFYPVLILIVISLGYQTFSATWYSTSLHRRLGIKVKVYMPVVMSVITTLSFGFGIGVGRLFAPMAGSLAIKSGWILLALTGLKIILESRKFHPEERVVLTDTWQAVILLALAGSINAFFGGIALGLVQYSAGIVLLLALGTTLIFSLAGILSGSKNGYQTAPARISLIAGMLLVVVSIWMLFINFNISQL